jgi:hypothetical protein
MAALVFALAGWRALILGVDTPIEQIAALTREVPIAAVALSCVSPDGAKNGTDVRALRRKLPGGIPLIVGGSSAPDVPGTVMLPDLAALDEWLRDRKGG